MLIKYLSSSQTNAGVVPNVGTNFNHLFYLSSYSGFRPNLYQKSFFECFALMGITLIYFESLLHVSKIWFWLYMHQLPSIWSDWKTKLMRSKVDKFLEQCNPFFCNLNVILTNLVSIGARQSCELQFVHNWSMWRIPKNMGVMQIQGKTEVVTLMAISGWTSVLFFNFMILSEALFIVIKCCNEKRSKVFFPLMWSSLLLMEFVLTRKKWNFKWRVMVAFWSNLPCTYKISYG
jgi:hypothetical protein